MTRYRTGGRKMISLRFDPDLLAALRKLEVKIGRNRTELLEEAAAALCKAHGISVTPTPAPKPRRRTASQQ